MSYFDRCPDRWEAEREGRRDAERQYNGYIRGADYGHFRCDEAQRAYEDGYRMEMQRQDELREEAEAERRAYARRAEEAAMEAAVEEEAYYRAMEEAQYQAEMENHEGRAPEEEEKP